MYTAGAPMVMGLMEATTPMGRRSMMVTPLSPTNTSGSRSSIPGAPMAQAILATVPSTVPRPVSSSSISA